MFFNPTWFELKIKEKIDENKILSCFLYNLKHGGLKDQRVLKIVSSILSENYSNKRLMKLQSKKEIVLSEKEKKEYIKLKKRFVEDVETYYLKNASFQTYKDGIKEVLTECSISFVPCEKTEIVFSQLGYFNLLKLDLNDKEKIVGLDNEKFKRFPNFYLYLTNLEKIKSKIAII